MFVLSDAAEADALREWEFFVEEWVVKGGEIFGAGGVGVLEREGACGAGCVDSEADFESASYGFGACEADECGEALSGLVDPGGAYAAPESWKYDAGQHAE